MAESRHRNVTDRQTAEGIVTKTGYSCEVTAEPDNSDSSISCIPLTDRKNAVTVRIYLKIHIGCVHRSGCS